MLIFLSMTPEGSGVWALLPARFVGAAAVAAVGITLKREVVPQREALLPAAAAGVLTVLANAAFIVAATKGSLAVVSVLASMFPASTVILARVVLGERLTPQRRLGLAMALVAVGLVAGG
jgi:drug/metabolite transporter (DMT)-like permease